MPRKKKANNTPPLVPMPEFQGAFSRWEALGIVLQEQPL